MALHTFVCVCCPTLVEWAHLRWASAPHATYAGDWNVGWRCRVGSCRMIFIEILLNSIVRFLLKFYETLLIFIEILLNSIDLY